MMKPTQNALRRVGYGVFSAMLTMGSASAGDSIVCIGDSLTSWGGGDISPSAAPANYMPDVLKGYSAKIHKPYGVYLAERVGPGFTVVNMSKAGGVTDSIMSWFGKKSLVTVSNLVFAAGQAKLDVAYSAKVVNWRCHNRERCEFPDITVTDRAVVERDFGGDASTGVNKLIGEMHGYGRVILGEKGVTRIGDCSQPLTIPAGTFFTPDSASLFRDAIHVIFTGTNDQANRLKDVADVVKDYVDTLPNARYVVLASHYEPNLSRHPEPYYRQLFGDHPRETASARLHAEAKIRGKGDQIPGPRLQWLQTLG